MGYYDSYGLNVSVLEGKTLVKVRESNEGGLLFETETGETYMLEHHQDCCESVYIEDINGDLNDLVGSPILMSSESSSEAEGFKEGEQKPYDCEEWTFYRFSTIKGTVVVRFYGTSNGYYSTSVDFWKE